MSVRSAPVEGKGDLIGATFVRGEASESSVIHAVSPADFDDHIGAFTTTRSHAARAVAAARDALPSWRRTGFEARRDALVRYRQALVARRDAIATAISRAVGKPLWEARTEADALVAKVDITLSAGQQLVAAREVEPGAFVRYRSIGVCAVLGPFNFPAHLANGHIVPLLAAGNTVVFKPSEKAPQVGELMAECFADAGFAPGVINVVQGAADVAQALVGDGRVDGVMFTGSTQVGRAILRASSEFAGRMLALEMGGNNPAIVLDDADVSYAAREIAFSAFVTAGQRCTAVRRVIVHERVARSVIEQLSFAARNSVIGPPSVDGAFMGPVINEASREEALALVEAHRASLDEVAALQRLELDGVRGFYLRPGVYVAKGELAADLGAREWFAPLVFVEVVRGDGREAIERAIERANATRFGLAAAVFTASRERFRAIADELGAGVVNWNRGTVGSSSKLPFGGVGDSGNHRAAGLYSALYCADPVAELHVEAPKGGAVAPGLVLPA
ncbi:MAG: aldehyde dehydrogenase family protein [Myxococcales bacterium]|nr:aldehyde dehydrogenase family protein [Myxococcales bacterium]